MDIERELEILIDKHKGKQVGLGETRLDWFAEDCLKEIRRLKSAIARQSVKSEEVQVEINRLTDALKQTKEAAKELKEQKYAVNMLPVYDQIKSLELQITALQAYQPWISVEDRLPEIPEGRYGVMCNVMVDNCSSTKVMSLLYEKDTVRGKTVCRWKWYGKISPWNVTHWKPLPEPPKGE